MRLLAFFTTIALLLLGSGLAEAQEAFTNPNRVMTGLDQVVDAIKGRLDVLFSLSTEYGVVVWSLFIFLVVLKSVWTYWEYTLGDFELPNVLVLIILFFLTAFLLKYYSSFTFELYYLANRLGDSFIMGLMNVDSPEQLLLIMSDISNVKVEGDGSWFTIDVGVILIEIALGLLMVVQYFAEAVATWGSIFSMAIGFLFVPFIVTEKTRGMFEGWLKLFFSFLFFIIFIRITFVLIAMLLMSLFGSQEEFVAMAQGANVSPDFNFTIEVKGIKSNMGVFVILFVAIFSMFKSYTYATSIAGGLSGGVMGGASLMKKMLLKKMG